MKKFRNMIGIVILAVILAGLLIGTSAFRHLGRIMVFAEGTEAAETMTEVMLEDLSEGNQTENLPDATEAQAMEENVPEDTTVSGSETQSAVGSIPETENAASTEEPSAVEEMPESETIPSTENQVTTEGIPESETTVSTNVPSGTEGQPATEQVPEQAVSPETEAIQTVPDVRIEFDIPSSWQSKKASIGISAEDVQHTSGFSIVKAEARISENGNWQDITQGMVVEVTANCSVYVRVTDQNGNVYEQNQYIECFDKTKPLLSASAKNGILIIRGIDEESGMAAIYVNGNEFAELSDGTLNVRLQEADTAYQYFTLQARDMAGNMSDKYRVANPYYKNPDAIKDTSGVAGTNQTNNTLPIDGAATKPTSATGTVIEHEITGDTEEDTEKVQEITLENDGETGRVQGDLSYVPAQTAEEGGKEFYTIQTKSDKVFYLIIDKDKTDNNVYLLTEVSENDLLNFTDNSMVTLPQNLAVQESALPLEPVVTLEEPEPQVTELPEEPTEPVTEEPEQENNNGTMLLMGVIVLVIGVGCYYLKIIKGKNNTFDSDYDEDEDEDEENEDDEEENEDEDSEE